jgi:lycopene cyclase domain-containing protein
MFEYMLVMLAFTCPFILFAVYKKRFTALGMAALMGLAIGVPWDFVSAGYFHTWFWNRDTLLGLWISPLPLEEYLFMALVPMMLVGAAIAFKIDLHISVRTGKGEGWDNTCSLALLPDDLILSSLRVSFRLRSS